MGPIPNSTPTSSACYTLAAMDLFRFDPPALTDDEVAQVARERYELTGTMTRLRGERSHNTLFTTDDGRQVVLKVASAGERRATIEFHAAALVHVERHAPELPIARMVPSVDGELVPVLEHDGRAHSMRLVTYLPGVTFEDDQQISLDGLRAIGSLVGALSASLAGFTHPAADDFMPWDIANGLILDADLWSGLSADAHSVLASARPRLEAISERMASLPRQVIHNDGHAGNLLRSHAGSDDITGVIDFGDLVRTVTVADVGVSGANLIPHQADPIAGLSALAAGFHAHRPLSDEERALLPELVLARLALSTLLIEYQIAHAPHIADAVAGERPGLLANVRRWLAIDPDEVTDRIEEAW
jgi:hydroxylysine kinase